MTPVEHSQFKLDDVDTFTVGARLFGCGGGGDAGIGRRLARQYFTDQAVDVLDPHLAAQQGATGDAVALGIAGAAAGPLSEQLPSGTEFPAVVNRFTSMGLDPQAIVALEAGGLNGLAALAAAAQVNLPVVDADLSGRAIPSLDQLSPAYSGASLLPAVLVDSYGRTLVVEAGTGTAGETHGQASYLEDVVRATVQVAGGWVAVGIPLGSINCLIDLVVPKVMLRVLQWGRILENVHSVAQLQHHVESRGGTIIGQGSINRIQRPSSSVPTGWFTVVSETSLMRVDMQNEFLAVAVDGLIVSTTPAVIGVLDARTLLPLEADQIRTATDVVIMTLPPSVPQRRTEYLERTGPRSFGLKFEVELS